MSTTAQFAELFAGRTDAFGVGAGRVVRRPLPDTPMTDPYRLHLAGKTSGLGIFPLLDDGTVRFAAIDLDEPDFEFARETQQFLPGRTWIERSRSGNAHVWAFFREPCEAWVARALMKGALEALGRPNVEVFPKQDRLLEGMLGNYINLPYHGDNRPIIDEDPVDCSFGFEWPVREFVSEALRDRIDPADWRARALALGARPPEQREATSEFGEQATLHPCATWIIQGCTSGDRPIRQGHRAAVLFALAKMLLNYRDLGTEEARQLLHEASWGCDGRVSAREVDRIFGNAQRGQFTSTGCDDPLVVEYAHPDCPIAHG